MDRHFWAAWISRLTDFFSLLCHKPFQECPPRLQDVPDPMDSGFTGILVELSLNPGQTLKQKISAPSSDRLAIINDCLIFRHCFRSPKIRSHKYFTSKIKSRNFCRPSQVLFEEIEVGYEFKVFFLFQVAWTKLGFEVGIRCSDQSHLYKWKEER